MTRFFPRFAEGLRDLDGRSAALMTLAALLLLLFCQFGSAQAFLAHPRMEALRGHPYLSVFADGYWFLSCFVLLGLVPFAATRLPPMRLPDSGLGLGDWRFGLRWVVILFGVMLPVVVAASRFEAFWRYYPLNKVLGTQATAYLAGAGAAQGFLVYFLVYEALYAVYFLGWEYFFRGFLTFGLHYRFGVNGVFIANIPFVLMHAGKPFPEALGSIVAGIALGLFALRARSFWYGWALHVLVAWTMDAASLQRRVAQFGP